MDAVLISGERLLLPLCLPSNDTDVLNILTYSFPTGKYSLSPSNPSVPPPWPISASSQHPAVRGPLPLFLYNLVKWLCGAPGGRKSSRIKELEKGHVGQGLNGCLWQSSTLAAGHCCAQCWPLGSDHQALPTPAPRPGSLLQERTATGNNRKTWGIKMDSFQLKLPYFNFVSYQWQTKVHGSLTDKKMSFWA